MSDVNTEYPDPMSTDQVAARKKRNLFLGLALGGFVILILVVTMIRIKEGADSRAESSELSVEEQNVIIVSPEGGEQ